MLFLGKMVLIISALLLVTASWPRFQAGLSELDSDSIYRANKLERSVTGEAYEHALLSMKRSAELNPASSVYYTQAADLSMRHALRLAEEGKSSLAQTEFGKSRLDAISGLERGPSDPYAWFVLAFAEQAIDGPSEAALSALSASFAAGLAEGNLLVPRISWCFGHWTNLPESLKEKAREQIRLALKNSNIRRSLAQYAATLPPDLQEDAVTIIEEVGAGEPDNLRKFRYWLRVSNSGPRRR